MKNEKYSSLKDLETSHEKLLELEQDISLSKTIKEREELDFLYNKGLNYIKESSPQLKPSNGQDYLMDEKLRLKFIKIGFQLEKKEFLEVDLINNVTEIKKDLLPPKPEPEIKSEKVEEKKEAAPVLIDDNYLSQVLIEKAQREGLTKETILDGTTPTDAGQFASSLVVDLNSADKLIDSIIKQVDERLNPSKTLDDVLEKEEEPKVEPSVNQKTKNKLTPPPPTPQPKPKQEVNTFKPRPQIDVSNKVAELREKFKRNQELNPIELEREQFQTVLKPQDWFNLPAKEVTVDNINAMQKRSKDGFKPDVVSTPDGPQEVRMKSSLK